MSTSRRNVLRIAGASLSGALLAGCLSGGESDPSDETDGTGGDVPDTELPRVDDPPYDVSEPACGGDGERDPLWLCANMPAEPSLEFEQVETSGSVFADEGLRAEDGSEDPQFYATLLRTVTDRDRLADVGGAVGDLLEGTDFDAEAVLVVQTGWGSGSETPHLKRIEETDDGIRAFGCSRRPCAGTDDYTVRTVLARFEQPEPLETGVASLTVDVDRRVTVAAGEGVVTVGAE